MRLAGKAAIVTGAASGIGRETALRFAEEGAAVVCADICGEGAAAVCREIEGKGGTAHPARADITEPGDAAQLVEEALAACGRIHILVNNAGVTILGGAAELSEAEWQREIDVNLSGAWRVSKAVWPHFAERGGGAILSTASIAGVLTRCMALDGAAAGIRANCICPGFVDTPMFDGFVAQQQDPARARADAARRTPLGRIGTPRDIADGFVYLASDDASWITGAALVIDGGLTAGLPP